MKLTRLAAIVVLLIGAEAIAQNSRAVLTGIVYDPEGYRISDVTVMVENPETKIKYQTQVTPKGNYAFSELPSGKYIISISKTGFKPYTSEAIPVSETQTVRFDVAIEAEKKAKEGEEEEEEEAEDEYYIDLMSRVDSSQWAHIVSAEKLKNLPLLGFSYGEGRLRNSLNALHLTPGSLITGQQYFSINGAPSNTESIRIEGQDVSNGIMPSRTMATQAGADAIEEFSIQTSNYAAEYGQAVGGLVNIAMKSGAGAYHGSAYTYLANEALNAPNYYTSFKPKDRRYNYGAELGGPVSIPKIYDGRDKTFIFLDFEQLRQENISDKAFTVPTVAFRRGDFRQVLTGRNLGTDAIGRSIMEGAIYNPAERIVNGKRIRNTYSSNIIPKTQFDSVAKLIQDVIPLPTDTDNTHVTNNYVVPWESPRLDSIGSFKLDHNFGRSKLSFYYGINVSDSSQSTDDGGDGIGKAITGGKKVYIRAQTYRMNYDRSMSPVRTLHVGLGYQGLIWDRKSAYGAYDVNEKLGLTGSNLSYFPYITGLTTVRGGMKDMGANMLGLSKMEKPNADASMTWVRGNHIFKFGGELRIEGYSSVAEYPAYGSLAFSAEQTGLPSTYGQDLKGGTIGFPYASFLLGLVDSGNIGVVSNPRLGKHGGALFVQDSWKATRRLTFEYGLRYDYQTYLKDGRGRMASFSATALNPAAGDRPGAMVYEGSGAGHCNCNFANIYKNAFGPRFGMAYQLSTKYILRAGFGVIYGQTATDNGATLNAGSTTPFFSTTYGNAARKLSSGFPSAASWPNLDINQTYIGSRTSPLAIHPDAGRPPRQIQWSIGLQREMRWKMLLEIAYVGNRGTGWESNGYANLNALTTSTLENLDLDITDADDRLLLMSPLNSSLASQKGYTAPYAGFTMTDTVAQSLRPYPQYGDILYRWAPIGKTWYDSVQVKVTKRYSRGIAATGGFSWQKERSAGIESEGAIIAASSIDESSELEANKHVSSLSRPYVFYIAPTYTFPKLTGNKYVSKILSDWQFSAMIQYASGFPIRVPNANGNLHAMLFQTTFENKTGFKYYLKNPNDRGIDPQSDFVLSPDAWVDPLEGQFSTSKAYYTDYRFNRRPMEQISFGRTVQINDKLRVNARIEFQNIANRHELADPYYIDAQAPQIRDGDNKYDDKPQSGFGYVSYRESGGNPRTGQVVVRLEF
jgi:hypothetical protein